jgi:hypothetical protein
MGLLLLVSLPILSSCLCLANMDQIFIRTAMFHGFLFPEDDATVRDNDVIGTPVMSRVTFPSSYDVEFAWCVNMGPSFFRNDSRGRSLTREKQLAFSAFCIDMHFCLGATDLPHKHQSADSLWSALGRTFEGRNRAGSLVQEALGVCNVEPELECDLWPAFTPSLCPYCAALSFCVPEDISGQLAQTSCLDVEDEDGNEDDFFDASSDALDDDELPAENEPAAWFADEELRTGTDEAELSDGEEYDGYNLGAESRRVMQEIDSERDEEKKVKLLIAAAYRQGRRSMREEVGAEWSKMAVFIAWSSRKSLNVYDTLRKIVMFEARKPFVYAHPVTGETVEVEPKLCSRLLSADLASASDIFKWKQADLKNAGNDRDVERLIGYWREDIVAYFKDSGLPVPEAIAFVPDSRHGRGNSFLLVFEEVQDAAAVRTQLFEIRSEPVKIVYVVNRRLKKRYKGGETAPNFSPTVADVQAQAKEMSSLVRGFHIDHLSPPEYMCARGHRVLAEKSVRLLDLPPSITKQGILDWFAQHGLFLTNVLKDNEIKNAKVLSPLSPGGVAWIVEFS